MDITVETKVIVGRLWEAMEKTTTIVMVEIRTIIQGMSVLNSVMVVMVVTWLSGTSTMEVTMATVGIRTTMVVIGEIKAIWVETGVTTTYGTTRISTMVATMIIMMVSRNKALGINIDGILMVDSTMKMEGNR
uniref:Uncharacterized protein n=1 Tax=Lactuca sativa TaxID=4236 RepID=A0A9R1V637_LACSA|nr:hypothetical protein LSAT_V11C600300610 [Lactuca sativa]